MNFNFLLNSALLGVGLAMDAFSVSMANGLREPGMPIRRETSMAGIYAGFQFMMPMIGWFCVHSIARIFTAFQPMIPWIALLLLLYIGGNMLWEGIRGGEEEREDCGEKVLSLHTLLLQGVATSIDALSVGFTIAEYGAGQAALASLIIALVTFGICFTGIRIGKKFGTMLAGRATILGGVILILIGIRIFLAG